MGMNRHAAAFLFHAAKHSRFGGGLIRSFALAATFTAFNFTTQQAHAVIKILNIERASVYENVTSSAGVNTVTVYGGMAGDAARCEDGGTSTTTTCNNCRLKTEAGETAPVGNPDDLLLPCNERRINPALLLSVTFSSDAIAGAAAVTSKAGDTVLDGSTSVEVAKGSTVTVTVPWSSICTNVFTVEGDTAATGSTCIPTGDSIKGEIRVGISAGRTGKLNATADDSKSINVVIRSISGTSLAQNCAASSSDFEICYFEMGPGDQKAIARTLKGPESVAFPALDYKFVRYLYAESGFNYVTLASPHQDLPISGSDTETYKVAPRRIENLENDKTYYFKTALIDAAGNVGLYSPKANDTDCGLAPDPTSEECRIVTPSEVVGVLDKTNCFIATAAYGTPFALEIDTLRDFRDQILMASDLGRNFVRFYYNESPYFAKMILESPLMRASVRAALVPVVWFAGMSLAYGPLKAGLAFLASLIMVAAMINVGRRPAVRNAALRNFNEVKDRARRSLLPLMVGFLLAPALSIQIAEAANQPTEASKNRLPGQVAVNDPYPEEPLDTSISPAEDETPPEPEYPYPGAQGLAPAPTPAPRPAAPRSGVTPSQASPLDRADQKFGTKQRPTAITEDGEYLYEKLPEVPAKKYGAPKAHKFSGRKDRETPSSITMDGEFTYAVAASEFTGAAGLRFGMLSPPRITNTTNGLTYKQIYGENDIPGLLFEYEYPLTSAIGRIGIKFETGAYYAQANGRFLRSARAAEVPEEIFTFLMVPLQGMIHYRFQYADNQLMVPFIEGGASYNGIVELRDDNKGPRFGGAPALIASGGVNILLDWIDRHAIRQLDAEYGINHVWFTAQYRQIIGLKEEIDFTTHLISAGFTFDF
jgi:hypothetical protein